MKIRLVGGIRPRQEEKHPAWTRNDRLIGVAAHNHALADIESLADLRPGLVDEIAVFFVGYNKLDGKKFHPLGDCNADQAVALIEKGARAFKKSTR